MINDYFNHVGFIRLFYLLIIYLLLAYWFVIGLIPSSGNDE